MSRKDAVEDGGPVTMGDLYPIRYCSPRGSVLTVHAGRLHEAVADWDYTRIYPACRTIYDYSPEYVKAMSAAAAVTCSKCRKRIERRLTRSQHYAWWLRTHGNANGWTYPPAQPSSSPAAPGEPTP